MFIRSCLILLIVSTCARRPEAVKDRNPIVVFYNVENYFDTLPVSKRDQFAPEGRLNWNHEKYYKKTRDIAGMLCSIHADNPPVLIGICEVENRNVLQDLVKTACLGSKDYGIVHEESEDPRGIDQALLYRKDQFRYLGHHTIEVQRESHAHERDRFILYVKGILSQRDTLHIYVNHWKSRSGSSAEKTRGRRIYSAKVLRQHIDSVFQKEKYPSVICLGDFNDEPDDSSLQILVQPGNEGKITRNRMVNLMLPSFEAGEGTVYYDDRWVMLDQILVSGALLYGDAPFQVGEKRAWVHKPGEALIYNEKADAWVPDRTYLGSEYAGGVSDHLPVYIVLYRNK